MGKIAIIATLTAKPGRFEELLELVRWMVRQTEGEPGTEVYAANTAAEEGSVWMYELYANEDAFAAHCASDAMRRFATTLADVAEPDVVAHQLSLLASAGLQK